MDIERRSLPDPERRANTFRGSRQQIAPEAAGGDAAIGRESEVGVGGDPSGAGLDGIGGLGEICGSDLRLIVISKVATSRYLS